MITAAIVALVYVALIRPMAVFLGYAISCWLEVHEGELPRQRVRMMRSLNVINILALFWPLTIFYGYRIELKTRSTLAKKG